MIPFLVAIAVFLLTLNGGGPWAYVYGLVAAGLTAGVMAVVRWARRRGVTFA